MSKRASDSSVKMHLHPHVFPLQLVQPQPAPMQQRLRLPRLDTQLGTLHESSGDAQEQERDFFKMATARGSLRKGDTAEAGGESAGDLVLILNVDNSGIEAAVFGPPAAGEDVRADGVGDSTGSILASAVAQYTDFMLPRAPPLSPSNSARSISTRSPPSPATPRDAPSLLSVGPRARSASATSVLSNTDSAAGASASLASAGKRIKIALSPIGLDFSIPLDGDGRLSPTTPVSGSARSGALMPSELRKNEIEAQAVRRARKPLPPFPPAALLAAFSAVFDSLIDALGTKLSTRIGTVAVVEDAEAPAGSAGAAPVEGGSFTAPLAPSAQETLRALRFDSASSLSAQLRTPAFFIEEMFDRGRAPPNSPGAAAPPPPALPSLSLYVPPRRRGASATASAAAARGTERRDPIGAASAPQITPAQLVHAVLSGTLEQHLIRPGGRGRTAPQTRKLNQHLAALYNFSSECLVIAPIPRPACQLLGAQAAANVPARTDKPVPVLFLNDDSDSLMVRESEVGSRQSGDASKRRVTGSESNSGDGWTAGGPNVLHKRFLGMGLSRADICCKFANSTWKIFRHLSDSVPIGGSIGMDQKSFTMNAPIETLCELWHFEGGIRVAEISNLRASVRLLVEGQAMQVVSSLVDLLPHDAVPKTYHASSPAHVQHWPEHIVVVGDTSAGGIYADVLGCKVTQLLSDEDGWPLDVKARITLQGAAIRVAEQLSRKAPAFEQGKSERFEHDKDLHAIYRALWIEHRRLHNYLLARRRHDAQRPAGLP